MRGTARACDGPVGGGGDSLAKSGGISNIVSMAVVGGWPSENTSPTSLHHPTPLAGVSGGAFGTLLHPLRTDADWSLATHHNTPPPFEVPGENYGWDPADFEIVARDFTHFMCQPPEEICQPPEETTSAALVAASGLGQSLAGEQSVGFGDGVIQSGGDSENETTIKTEQMKAGEAQEATEAEEAVPAGETKNAERAVKPEKVKRARNIRRAKRDKEVTEAEKEKEKKAKEMKEMKEANKTRRAKKANDLLDRKLEAKLKNLQQRHERAVESRGECACGCELNAVCGPCLSVCTPVTGVRLKAGKRWVALASERYPGGSFGILKHGFREAYVRAIQTRIDAINFCRSKLGEPVSPEKPGSRKRERRSAATTLASHAADLQRRIDQVLREMKGCTCTATTSPACGVCKSVCEPINGISIYRNKSWAAWAFNGCPTKSFKIRSHGFAGAYLGALSARLEATRAEPRQRRIRLWFPDTHTHTTNATDSTHPTHTPQIDTVPKFAGNDVSEQPTPRPLGSGISPLGAGSQEETDLYSSALKQKIAEVLGRSHECVCGAAQTPGVCSPCRSVCAPIPGLTLHSRRGWIRSTVNGSLVKYFGIRHHGFRAAYVKAVESRLEAICGTPPPTHHPSS